MRNGMVLIMRLIDADALDTRERGNNSQRTMWWNIKRLIDAAPTIDPASLRPKGEWITASFWKRRKGHHVQLLIDKDVLKGAYVGCHPCINTSSLRIPTADLMQKVIPAMNHEPRIVTLG